MTAFKNTGRAAHTLPRNIQRKRTFQRAGPIFNRKIEGVKHNGRSSFVINKVTQVAGKRKGGFRKTNKYGQFEVDGETKFHPGCLKENDASRVHVTGVILGYRRSREQQKPKRCLLEIVGCKTKDDAKFYLGKRVLYIYKVKSQAKSDPRVLVGKVTRTHGNTGVVQVNWERNISPTTFGKRCRVLLYPATN